VEHHIHLRLLGPVQAERDGQPVPGLGSGKGLALLGYLVVHGGPVSREYLADLFWRDKPEERGRANLSWTLHKLSSRLPGCLETSRHTVRFRRTEACWLDLDAFEGLTAGADAASLAEAVELYRGEFLEGLSLDDCADFELWLVGERERWRQRVAEVLGELVAFYTRRGEVEQGVRCAKRLLVLEPWREEAHRAVMRLLALSGQRGMALAQYETCRRVLVEELGVEPMPETTALYERIRLTGPARRHNLPLQPTSFVGREEELTEISELLDNPDCRLLTLVGPGGIGKTRLALQAAKAKTEAFLEGVYFVPLGSVSSAEFLVSAIADALQYTFSGSLDPKVQLLNYLREKETLLVLDSFEHLIGRTGLLVEMLRHAPGIKLLVTSRERLNLRWEWCLEVQGLKYPKDGPTNGRKLEDYDAVQLFQQVAGRVRYGFSLSKRNRSAVVRICQLVEGMPLGIELAAAWVGGLTCREVVRKIERQSSSLATSLGDVPTRHRSLWATFEHSWHLLALSEQQVFMKLSVFRGGFQQESADDVANASPAALKSLVDKSLLRLMPSGRYEIHELLRKYAAEKLSAAPQAQVNTRNRHCAHFVALLERQEANLVLVDTVEALTATKVEIENIREAWRWAVARAEIEAIDRALNGLSRYYLLAGPFQAGETAIRMAEDCVHLLVNRVDQSGQHERTVLSKLLVEKARFLNRQGKYDQAIDVVGLAVDLISRMPTRTPQIISLEALGHLLWGQALFRQGDYQAAKTQLEEALTQAVQSRKAWQGLDEPSIQRSTRFTQTRMVEAGSRRYLGNVLLFRSDYAGAKVCYDQALEIYREIGDRRGESGTLNNLAIVARSQGDFAASKVHHEQALSIKRKTGDRWGEGASLNGLGLVFADQGDYASARIYLEQALRIFREMGDRQSEGHTLNDLGLFSLCVGDYTRAKACLKQALAIFCKVGDRRGECTALLDRSLLFYYLGDNQAAWEHSQRALLIAQDLGVRSCEGYALTRMGYASEGSGNLEEAEAAYRDALALRQELNQLNRAMEVRAGLVRVSLAQGNLIQAQVQVEEILNHLEDQTLDGTVEPLRVYLTCYHALRANQDPRAEDILETAYNLLQSRAAKTGSEELRRSFLENVRAHREILMAWEGAHTSA